MTAAVAVTGATGFIGGRIVERLLQDGWGVRALVRGAADALEARRAPEARGATTVVGSLEDENSLIRLITGACAVVHCAGAVRAPRRDAFDAVNVRGTARLVAAAAAGEPAPRFVLISSLAAREPHLSAYAASKKAGEDALCAGATGAGWCIIRPPAVYGPGDRMTLALFRQIARGFVCAPAGDGHRFSLLYVDDLAAAVSALLAGPSSGSPWGHSWAGERLELDDGRPGGYSWAEIADIAAGVLGRPVRRVPVGKPVLWAPAAVGSAWARATGRVPMLTLGKLRELFHRNWVAKRRPTALLRGWAPHVRFDEGFARTFAWYEARGMLP